MLREFLTSRPATFETTLSADESVVRLRASVAPVTFSWSSDFEALTGSVSRSRVRLRRVYVQWTLGTGFATIFVGHFVHRSRGAVLVGRFTVAPFARAALVGLFLVIGAAVAGDLIVADEVSFGLFLLLPIALLLLRGLADLCASVSRQEQDIAYITDAIHAALAPDVR